MVQEVVQTKLTDPKHAADELCKQLRNQPESYNCVIFFAATESALILVRFCFL